jgi:hypothetical protein
MSTKHFHIEPRHFKGLKDLYYLMFLLPVSCFSGNIACHLIHRVIDTIIVMMVNSSHAYLKSHPAIPAIFIFTRGNNLESRQPPPSHRRYSFQLALLQLEASS